jgi:hypothetical protein
MSDTFDQFVKQQIESSKSEGGTLDLEKELGMWRGKLDQLYALVANSLSEYTADGSIGIDFSQIELTEELLGTYTVMEGLVTVGRQVVKLRPIGTFLVGARGRVDMSGPRGITRLVIVPPEARAPQVRVTLTSHGERKALNELTSPPESWVWKIATPAPRITYIDLTKESFREALIGVVNG